MAEEDVPDRVGFTPGSYWMEGMFVIAAIAGLYIAWQELDWRIGILSISLIVLAGSHAQRRRKGH